MKLEGFIGPAYQLDSVNVDAQACVNLYPEVIESGKGKGGQVAYLRATPGYQKIAEIGNGPIRCIHTDSIGRIFVVSGNQIFSLTKRENWRYRFDDAGEEPATASVPNTNVYTGDDEFESTDDHGFYTGQPVKVETSDTLPSPLDADTVYYVIKISDKLFALATSFENALAGERIDISTLGTGTHTFTAQKIHSLYNVEFRNGSFFKPGHNYGNGAAVKFVTNGPGLDGAEPDTTYYVVERSEDTFKLSEEFDGAPINVEELEDQWFAKLLGTEGEFGGDPFVLSSSHGVVKAASMSFGGDGTDSSTIFVDGQNNYLLKDEAGQQSLEILGEVSAAQAVFDLPDDIIAQTTENVDFIVANSSIAISASTTDLTPLGVGDYDAIIFFEVNGDITNPSVHWFSVRVLVNTGKTLTTAELVECLNTGTVLGKKVGINVIPPIILPFPPMFVDPVGAGTLLFRGGGSQSVTDAFDVFGTQEPFKLEKLSGEEYGSVPTARQIVWSDGYFILNKAGTNQFFVSDLQSFNVDALSFTSSEGSPDILLALVVSNRYLYAFNEKTTEVYANTGNADFPYERIQGGFVEIGLAAEYSVAKVGDAICFLGRTNQGQGTVFIMEGVRPRRISTHAIEYAIRSYADISKAKAFAYSDGGHGFYVLNFDEATWVYDFGTGLWHQRAYLDDGDLKRDRPEFHAFDIKRGIHLVSDFESNKIYHLSEDFYTHDGNEIPRIRSSPHISADLKTLFYSKFQLDMETGIGLDGGVQGSNPTVMLDWSDDGGHTWSSEKFALADAGSGQIGDFKKRVVWRRLGRSRDRVFRVKISDPVKVRLIDAQIEARVGAN